MKIICDIDGTVADLTHRLHFIKREKPDWDSFFQACDEDTPIKAIIRLLTAIDESHHRAEFIYVSGRSEVVRKKTHRWLSRNLCPPGELRMRPEGDHSPDYKMKAELTKDIDPKDVWLVFDDRRQVVDMWRERGFRVLQVAEGDF